jgi:hypothetical protein
MLLPRRHTHPGLLVTVAAIAGGMIASTARGQSLWSTFGNSGLGASNPRLGHTDNVPLVFVTNNSRGMLLEHANVGGFIGTNVTAGSSGNLIRSGVYAGTVAGGGYTGSPLGTNSVYALGGTVGGGAGNNVGEASGTINIGAFGTVCGGQTNAALGAFSTVMGGEGNIARGRAATTAGGSGNSAGGDYSFAGGRLAYVRRALDTGDSDGDQGTFVWADATNASFASTGPNQFLVRASGGVGFGTNNPAAQLGIRTDSNVFFPHIQLVEPAGDYTRLTMRSEGSPRFWTVAAFTASGSAVQSDRINFFNSFSGDVMVIRGNGTVGIGTSSPGSFKLAVNGDAAKPGGGSWSVFCDPRLKEAMRPMRGTLDKLLQLRGYEFRYKPEAVEKNLALPGEQLGLNAEEVERVFPQWVERDGAGYRYVTERATTALMVEALRDLRAEKDAQIGALKAQNEALRARLEAIEAKLAPR